MKIKFEDNLDYQMDAIKAVTDIFNGQEENKALFTVESRIGSQLRLGTTENELGIGNRLLLLPEDIQKNLNEVQLRNGLEKTKNLKENNYNFSIEMETGTGKTYVYIRTILELNKKYGFRKFVIVVPSIAIKEGVNKTLEITKEHFKKLYDNVPYDFFTYDSKKIDMIRNFAVNDSIQIIVINIDSFNKDSNIIKDERDQANGYKPIEYIQQCNPIVIIDEPQNMETENAKKAISELNPLCTLRYSATHKDKYNSVFKLNSIDAYERELVKQIEVATIGITQNKNREYIKVTEIKADKSGLSAKLELDINNKSKVIRKIISVKDGDYLDEKAKRDIYKDYKVNEITYNPEEPSKSFIDLGKVKLYLNQINGGENPDTIKRLQIRKTIEEHFEKQMRLRKYGIKVLSLFFIDKVSNYRTYDPETGEPKKGKYALIFEEEYEKLLERKEYQSLNDQSIPLKQRILEVHNGYFSADKKKSKSGKEYFEEKDTKGNTIADNDTFNKIMRDKEKLLSFEEPLSFIFSHSALREGWDNPNVFQICTLNETNSEMKKRQEIGRGLRIAVNQSGQRIRGFEVNTLTVMANESYENFVSSLQRELEEENEDFGIIKNYLFANILIRREKGKDIYLGHEKSNQIYEFLLNNKYINIKGYTEEKLNIALKEDKLSLPEEFQSIKEEIIEKLKSNSGRVIIKNANDRKKIFINKEVIIGEEFKELWEKIKYKTTYKVNFNNEKLIQECIKNIDNELNIEKRKYSFEKRILELTQGQIKSGIKEFEEGRIEFQEREKLPDILTYLQNETNLTRKSIVEILANTRTLNSFKENPQSYIEEVTEIIKRTMKKFIVEGIKYEKIGDSEYYCQELFEAEELFGYLKSEKDKESNMVESRKSPYTNIVIDSDIERSFAQKLEENKNVVVYAKLPAWFKIATPLGNYNPDWAVLVRPNLNSIEEKLYFIVETKGSKNEENIRLTEKLKIDCGREHFKAISNNLKFEITDNFENFSGKF